MKMILKLVKPYYKTLTMSLSFKTIAAITDLFLPWLIAYMIDKEIPKLKMANDSSLRSLYFIGALMVATAFLGLVLNIIANRTAEMIAANAVEDLRYNLFSKITSLSNRQIDDLTKPSLISRMTTDTYNMYQATASMQRIGVRAPVLLIGGILMALLLDPVMTLIMVLMLPFILVIVTIFSKKGIPLYKKTQESADKYIRKLREYISGVRIVRALSMHEHEINKFDELNQNTVDNEQNAQITMAKINPLMQAVMNIGLVFVLVVGAYRLKSGHTEKGQIMAFVTYFTIILNAMMSITRVFVLASRATASANRIDEVLNLEKDIIDGDLDYEVDLEKPHISFSNVSFSYLNKKHNIEDISFSLEKGKTLGVIGPTGSGKTTLINLLMRFYDVNSGSIKIYGKDIKDLKTDDIRKRIGVVFQNDVIFADSIYGNIKFNREMIKNEDIEIAIKVAQANFVYNKSEDLAYEATQKGTNLSGGQKQRLLIARALAGKPELLIFDDASSALDYKTDQSFRSALKSEFKDTTKIIIAQRISSIKDADYIILLDEGKIIASGTHAELLAKSDIYQKIAYYQLGGAIL